MAKILVVDDDNTVLVSLGVLLKSEGHSVIPISRSDQVEKYLREDSIDLMITDIRMAPIDGMELLKLAKEIRPGMPVIVISAYSSDATAKQGYDLGAFDYIPKPFKINQVVDSVERALKVQDR